MLVIELQFHREILKVFTSLEFPLYRVKAKLCLKKRVCWLYMYISNVHAVLTFPVRIIAFLYQMKALSMHFVLEIEKHLLMKKHAGKSRKPTKLMLGLVGHRRPMVMTRWQSSFLSMKWQWTYGPTLLPWSNHFYTSKACLTSLRMYCIDTEAIAFMFNGGSSCASTIHPVGP